MGPLLKLAEAESVGFHFVGGSSCGKSTALDVASWLWGKAPDSWRSTDNGAEGTAELANDGFLAPDELGQADGRAVDAMAYMLANGQGKRRASKSGGARDVKSWRVAFLSSGEVGVADKLADVGKRHKAGQAVRILEVPADAEVGHGLFEVLHDHAGGAAFSVALKSAAQAQSGHAARAFLEHLVAESDGLLAETLSALRAAWCAEYVPEDADAQVERAAGAFALAAAAGHLATLWGVVPWPQGWASEALGRCFRDWVEARGGSGAHEVRQGLESIQSFIQAHGASRFEVIGGDARIPSRDRAGFIKDAPDRPREYWVFASTMHGEILGGSQDAKRILQAGAERGLIVLDNDGKPPKRELPGLGRKRVYVVRLEALDGQDGGAS